MDHTDQSYCEAILMHCDDLGKALARIAELEALVRETYPMVVDDVFGCGVEITDFQFWKRRAVLIVPPLTTASNPTPFRDSDYYDQGGIDPNIIDL